MNMVNSGALLLLLAVAVAAVSADIVFENELFKTEDIFDLDYAQSSDYDAYKLESQSNSSQYYCVFRSYWNEENHPAEYPELARWSDQVLISHTKQYAEYAPFIKNRRASYGVEQIAETAFTDTFKAETTVAGEVVLDLGEGKGFFINQRKVNNNFSYLEPIKVTTDHSFISGITGLGPSPDWFTHFYFFNTIKENELTYWDSFKIRTYPWDAGTDDGVHYADPNQASDPPEFITRIEVGNTVNDIFLSPTGDKVPHVAEWECVLHTCPSENPNCEKPNWPPSNGCDILRYPLCNQVCDPSVDEVCEQCLRELQSEDKIFSPNCCLAGRTPKGGGQCGVPSSATPSASVPGPTNTTTDSTPTASPLSTADDFCNICGQGNTIQFPTGILEFHYEGRVYKNNCQTWQSIVMNPNAIPDEFCRNDLLQYTASACRCTTPAGDPVVVPMSPAPTVIPGVVVPETSLTYFAVTAETNASTQIVCTDLGARCVFQRNLYSDLSFGTGQETQNEQGAVWAYTQTDAALTLGQCVEKGSDCLVSCNANCTCTYKSDETTSPTPCTEAASLAPTPTPAPKKVDPACPKRQFSTHCGELMASNGLPMGLDDKHECFNFCGGVFVSTCDLNGSCGNIECGNMTAAGTYNGQVLGCTIADKQAFVDNAPGLVYESGSTRVNVTMESLDEHGSNKKCAKFLSNAPEKYDMACFSSVFTDGGTFFACDVQFGNEICNRCTPCETNDEMVGYKIDCFNVQPAENTNFLCVELTDRAVQEVLVDEIFAVDFNFEGSLLIQEPAPTLVPTSMSPEPAPEYATQFTVPKDKVIVCSDSLKNICVASTDCNKNGQLSLDPGNNTFVGEATQRDGVWTIVGGYTISFPSVCNVTCEGVCTCDGCVSSKIFTVDKNSLPSTAPSTAPSVTPSAIPSQLHSDVPSAVPSLTPSLLRSDVPSTAPSRVPSMDNVGTSGAYSWNVGVVSTLFMLAFQVIVL